MRRPGPLRELPLEQFLPKLNLQANGDPFKMTPNKRPLSPGTPITYSPTKRRILDEELFFSPEKTPRTGRSLLGRFGDLRGPGSPAKKLDFGPPKNAVKGIEAVVSATHNVTAITKSTRAQSSVPRKLAPSPELKSRSRPSHKPASSLKTDEEEAYNTLSFHRPHPNSIPIMIPREMPPSPDRQSIHYPGFDIYRDTRIICPQGRSLVIPEQGADKQKENIPPLRRSRKAESAWSDAEKGDVEVSGKMCPTPQKKSAVVGGCSSEGKTTPVTRRSAASNNFMDHSHSSTPIASKAERRDRRMRMLEYEVDGGGGDVFGALL
jgi:hypothetical protein